MEIGLTARKLADFIQVPPHRLYQILAGKRNMTADTALRLSPYELDLARQHNGKGDTASSLSHC